MAQSTAPSPSLIEKKDENTKTTDSVNNNSESLAITDDDKDAKPIKGILLKPGEVPHHKDQELKMDKSTQVKEAYTPGTKYEDHKIEGKRGLVQRRKSGTRLFPKPATDDEEEDEEDEEKQKTAQSNSKINTATASEPPLPIFTNPQALAKPTQELLAQSAEAASTPTSTPDEKEKKKGGLRIKKLKGSNTKNDSKEGKEKGEKGDKDKDSKDANKDEKKEKEKEEKAKAKAEAKDQKKKRKR